MRRFITIILLLPFCLCSYAQDSTDVKKPGAIGRYWQSLIHGNVDRTHEKAFDMSVAVAPTYTAEGGIGLGANATGLYRLDRKDSTMAPSNITFAINGSLKGFATFTANGINYFADKRSKIVYNAQFSHKILDFWGIRFDDCRYNPTSQYTKLQFKTEADYSYLLSKYFSAGAVININYTGARNMYHPEYLCGMDKSYFLAGIGLSLQYDSRDNTTNPHKGLYIRLKETIYPEFLGTCGRTNFATSFVICGYQPLWKGALIAGDLYMQLNDKNAPWTLREDLGGVMGRMRGYYAGRYIDSCQAAAQIEIRQHIVSRFGCVAWVGAGTVFPSIKEYKWDNLLPNGGIGLRFEFKHNVNIRLDFGFGKDTAGLCFAFAEAF